MVRAHFITTSVAALLLCAGGAIVQAGTVSGQIKSADGKPVAHATVSVGEKFDFTDVDGKYRIKDAPEGAQRMQIKKGDEILKETPVDVPATSTRVDETVR